MVTDGFKRPKNSERQTQGGGGGGGDEWQGQGGGRHRHLHLRPLLPLPHPSILTLQSMGLNRKLVLNNSFAKSTITPWVWIYSEMYMYMKLFLYYEHLYSTCAKKECLFVWEEIYTSNSHEIYSVFKSMMLGRICRFQKRPISAPSYSESLKKCV